MNSNIRDFIKAIQNANKKPTSAYDTSAKVTRVEGKTAWVHVDGGVEETPVEMSISCEPGDDVRVRINKGAAYIIGNNTNPPTNDRIIVKYAADLAQAAREVANRAYENLQEILSTYVTRGSSNISTLSSAMTQTDEGTNVYDSLATDSHYLHVDADGIDLKTVANGNNGVDDSADKKIVHAGTDTIQAGPVTTGTRGSTYLLVNDSGLTAKMTKTAGSGDDARDYQIMHIGAFGSRNEIGYLMPDDQLYIEIGDSTMNKSYGRGPASVMIGGGIAKGTGAMVFGEGQADGNSSVVIGQGWTTGASSVAIGGMGGSTNKASGNGAVSIGVYAYATGYLAISLGGTASGRHALSEGAETIASGEYSHAGGLYTKAGYTSQTTIGKYNSNRSDTLFEVGNGTDDNARSRSNAFDVTTDGYIRTGVGSPAKVAFGSVNNYYGWYDSNGSFSPWAFLVNGKVPESLLPSYVDDVIEGYYYNGSFYEDDQYQTLITPERGKIYISLDTDKSYRWSGTVFVELISGGVVYTAGDGIDISATNVISVNNDIARVADIPTVPTNVSAFVNDAGYLTQHQDLSNYIQKSLTAGLVKNDGTIDTTDYAEASDIPDVSNFISKSQTSGLVKNDGTIDTTDYAEASDIPDVSNFISKSQTSGLVKNDGTIDTNMYALSSDIPTKTSDLTNDSGFITSASLPTKTSDLTNDSGFITSAALADYLPLTGGTLTGTLNTVNIAPTTDNVGAIGASNKRYSYGYVRRLYALESIEKSTDTSKRLLLPDDSGTIALTKNIPSIAFGTQINSGILLGTLTLNGTNYKIYAPKYTGGTGINIDSSTYEISVDTSIIPDELADLSDDSTHRLVTDTEKSTWNGKSDFSGSYNDLTDKPSIPAAQVNADWNATSGVARILNKPTLATVATSGSYNDLSNKPTIPSVGNGTITIQKNGSTIDSFTTNQSSAKTINISISKSDVGLSNVENKSSATIRGELTSSNVTTALGYTPLNSSNPSASGRFTIGGNGYVHMGQEPYAAEEWDTFVENAGISVENGINICQDYDETSGIHMDGGTIVMWSPCDEGALWYYDEDSGDPVFHIDSNGNYYNKAGNTFLTSSIFPLSIANGGTGNTKGRSVDVNSEMVTSANVATGSTTDNAYGVRFNLITGGANNNCPNGNWFSTITMNGDSSGTEMAGQLAIGMTEDSVYYRRNWIGGWTTWKRLAFADENLPLAGGTMTGASGIQFPTAGGNNKSGNWISAGGGYSTGSGKSGVKIIVCDQSDGISGLGQDCGGGPYELSVIAAAQSGTGTGYIRFLKHVTDSTTYTKLAEIDGGGNFIPQGSIRGNNYANGYGVNIGCGLDIHPQSSSAGYGGYIDFHYNQSSADYTSRILESSSSHISIQASNGTDIGGNTVINPQVVENWQCGLRINSEPNRADGYAVVTFGAPNGTLNGTNDSYPMYQIGKTRTYGGAFFLNARIGGTETPLMYGHNAGLDFFSFNQKKELHVNNNYIRTNTNDLRLVGDGSGGTGNYNSNGFRMTGFESGSVSTSSTTTTNVSLTGEEMAVIFLTGDDGNSFFAARLLRNYGGSLKSANMATSGTSIATISKNSNNYLTVQNTSSTYDLYYSIIKITPY